MNHPPKLIKRQTSKSFAERKVSAHDEQQSESPAGKHFILDMWHGQKFDDLDFIEQALKDAARAGGATLLHIHLHQFTNGGGITGVALLAESHISVHTWPERDYAAFDIFMCGNAKPELAVKQLLDVFTPDRYAEKEILRG